MGKRLVATQTDINTALTSYGWWISVANGSVNFDNDMNTMQWKDFKKKYQSIDPRTGKARITNETNFRALLRKTYATLQLSNDPRHKKFGAILRIIYTRTRFLKAKKKKQTGKQKQKYPFTFYEHNGANTAVCHIDYRLKQFTKTSTEHYNLDVSYYKPERSAVMLYNALVNFHNYVNSDITLNSISNRFTIIIETNRFKMNFSSNRKKYYSHNDIWNEIENQFIDMVVYLASAEFYGMEIDIEGIL